MAPGSRREPSCRSVCHYTAFHVGHRHEENAISHAIDYDAAAVIAGQYDACVTPPDCARNNST